jgi:hypothetical protein
MDQDSLRIVAEDLQFLAGWNSGISAPEIRRGSATLRRLLIEGAYSSAWRAAGFEREPSLIAVDLSNVVAPSDLGQVVFVLAAGAEFRGRCIASAMLNTGPSPPPPINDAVLRPDGFPGERVFRLSEYLRSASAYAFGEWITRGEVVKYIANVRGGVHLSQSQKKSEAVLVERVSPIERRIIVFETEGLLVELVAIAQAIGRSEDARRLIHEVGG